MPLFICQGCGAEHTAWNGTCPVCGTSETIRLAPSSDRMVDRVIKGKFKILKKLGQGGMGAVYLAEQSGIGHKVALKFLKAEFSADVEIARRFLNEAKSYALVAHPNAVSFRDFGQDDDGNLFIAMEYCEGTDLKKEIAEHGRLQLGEATEVVLQVADVLANAHQKGVIHRDLKPENIMINRGLRGVHAKVLDFGIARLMDAGTRLTHAGAIAGTPRYMSPEQVEGKEVDPRCDIYSLGVVLFECLTGRQPFDGSTIAEILRKQMTEPLPHLTEFHAGLDYPDLDAVVQKACAKKREQRWNDMVAFAGALSQAMPTQPELGASPQERSSRYRAAALGATPLPATVDNLTPASSPSGIARPDAPVEASSSNGTMLKPLDPSERALTPIPDLKPSDFGRRPPRRGGSGGEEDLAARSLAGRVPGAKARESSSPAPMIAAAVGVVVVLIGAGALLLGGKKAELPPAPVVVQAPEPVRAAAAPPPDGTVGDEVRKALLNTQVQNDFARGNTDFEAANLENALIFLEKIPPDSDLRPKAEDLMKKIQTIRDTLELADRARGSGHCERAEPLYVKVLGLNGRVKDAQAGLGACRAARIDTTMP